MRQSRPTTQQELAFCLLQQHGIMRQSDLQRRGINPGTLARLVDAGLLHRPSRGLYELADADIDAAHALAEVARRVPKGVICLISALQYHEMTLQLPRNVWVAIGQKGRAPAVGYPPIRVARFSDQALALGVRTYRIDSVPVRIFDPAKSIVDCFRFRTTVGLDVALEALRMGWRARKVKPDDIARYAKALRIWTVVRPYLESVVADEG